MASEIESHIAKNCVWEKLPLHVRQLLGNHPKEYEKQVTEYSIKTQQRFRGNLVFQIVKNERAYYEEVLNFSRAHLMLYPYHLSDVVVKGLRVTPFQYYISVLSEIMTAEKSYDSLPNFTAADCLRLLGIGRNQYIDLMNQCRSSRKLFRRKNVRDLLPPLPCQITIEPWWMVCVGGVTEEDVKSLVRAREKVVIDSLIDNGPQRACDLDRECVLSLYIKGLVYLDIPISNTDLIAVPPLEGFVMNRVLGDYLESLMYKIFVSLDEHTPVCELASVLEIDLALVKVAVSLFCRLGFAHKKHTEISSLDAHPSWEGVLGCGGSVPSPPLGKSLPAAITTADDLLLRELESALAETMPGGEEDASSAPPTTPHTPLDDPLASVFFAGQTKRIAFLYDSTLTAFLMMGNLSQGLKSHAVTMFEVGKMLDEGLDSLISELDKIQRSDSEGEAQRYFEHALTLRTSISFLRHNPDLFPPPPPIPPPQIPIPIPVPTHQPPLLPSPTTTTTDATTTDAAQDFLTNQPPPSISTPASLDLIRWESLSNLDPATTARLLKKNYQFLVSMAPLSYEISAIEGETPPHFGPAIPEVNSIWFKLYIYHITGSGPPSLLLPQGERLRRLPGCLLGYEKVLVTPWGHDPTVVPLAALFTTVNEALMHSPVFIQAYGWYHDVCIQHIPFPLEHSKLAQHKAIQTLSHHLDLEHTFGYIKLVAFPLPHHNTTTTNTTTTNTTIVQPPMPPPPPPPSTTTTMRLVDLGVDMNVDEENIQKKKKNKEEEEMKEISYKMEIESASGGSVGGHGGGGGGCNGGDGGLSMGLPSVVSFEDVSCLSLESPRSDDTDGKSDNNNNNNNNKNDDDDDDYCGSGGGGITVRAERANLTLPLSDLTSPHDPSALAALDQYQLLECHYGLPLFDATLNHQVSKKITTHRLFSVDSVEKFSASNKRLTTRLREFISNNKAQGVSAEVRRSGGCREGVSNLPLPTTPLLFSEGTLAPWEGS